jgi:sugar phosphate isomerase/epimerase
MSEGRGPLDRRAFLGALGAIPLAGALTGCGASDEPAGETVGGGGAESGPDPANEGASGRSPSDARVLPALGVQLYTLREAIAEDIDATLAAVAEIGYEEVELFQLHGLTPAEMRGKLDAVGLRAGSSHYDLNALREDLGRHVDGALEIGQRLMVVPSISGDERSPEGLARVAEDFNRIGEAVRGAGMRFGYHNHDWEFQRFDDGSMPMDILLDETDEALVDWQMDLFWTVHGGSDPLEQMSVRSGRVTSVHVKDRTAEGRMVDVGDGVIDFASLLVAAGAQGLLHAFVEHDTPGDAVESVRRSYQHLATLGVVG